MINTNLQCYLANIDGLRNLVRYQTAPKVSSETVAEHSFFVAAYVLKLNDYYEFNLEKALMMGLLHDFSEVYISDVPHPIKSKFPQLNSILEQEEYNVNYKFISKEFADNLEEFNHLTSVEGMIIALADVLSVVTYSKYEIGLGNSNYMKDVYNRTKPRYISVIEKLEPYLKDGHTSDEIIDEINQYMKINEIDIK